jgi:stage III sporulation protein SpoIIIAA
MDQFARLSHLGQYLKIFSLYMHFIFFFGHNKQTHVTIKGGHRLGTPQACTCGKGVGVSTVLAIIGHFLSKE